MRFIRPPRHRYRPQLLPWLSADDIGSAVVLVALGWLIFCVLPALAPDLRQILIDLGFTAGLR